MKAFAKLLVAVLVAMVVGVGVDAATRSPARPEPLPTSPASQPGATGPFPSLSYRDTGATRVILAEPPRSTALAGANDLLAAGSVIFAATQTGVSRSIDGGSSWQQVLTGVPMMSLSAAAGGGFVALGDRQTPSEGENAEPGQLMVATSPDGVRWRLQPARVTGVPSSAQFFYYDYRVAFSGIGPTAVGVAVPFPPVVPPGPPVNAPPLRSADGGRDWVR